MGRLPLGQPVQDPLGNQQFLPLVPDLLQPLGQLFGEHVKFGPASGDPLQVTHTPHPTHWTCGAGHAGFAPVGPWLVTPDEFDNPGDLELRCAINDEEVQKGRTRDLLWAETPSASWPPATNSCSLCCSRRLLQRDPDTVFSEFGSRGVGRGTELGRAA
ncbi:fumarylacetoacetate hydrolase family protein [Streptomyces sp. NPDC001797]|uniref:fumarylacetoacetate hydrolase family protein n=1 Tax=Streptomyces sp. NPDC001797 TaxID=3364610 RepID=UPI00367D4CE2